MKIEKINLLIISLLIATVGCSSSTDKSPSESQAIDSVSTTMQDSAEPAKTPIPQEYFGIYEGDQKSYTMKNQFGDDMVVAGKPVKVPASNYKLIFKENNVVEMQQTSLEDQTRYYFKGDYTILSDNQDAYELECKLSDGQSSSPTYKMTLNKADFTVHCIGNNEPDFDLLKQGVEQKNKNEVAFEGILGTESQYSGEWSINIKITGGEMKGQKITAYFSTCGLGMEDKYAIETAGDAQLDGSDENNGRRVKGVLLKSKGQFADVSGMGGPKTREVWRIKELNFN